MEARDLTALRGNNLLETLDDATLEALAPQVESVRLEIRHMLYEPKRPMQYAYFPIEGVISMVAEIDDGPASMVEVATVGKEGMLGLPLFLGSSDPPGYAFAQVAGQAHPGCRHATS